MNFEILDLNEVKLFHAGTKKENGELLTSGGRVFSLNTKAPDLEACKKIIYTNIKNIKFNNMVYRKDIGDIYES